MAFFGGYAVLGPNGVLAYGEYRHQLAAKKVTYEALDHQRAELRNRVNLLDHRHANPDLVDELARKKLNVVHPDEIRSEEHTSELQSLMRISYAVFCLQQKPPQK